MTYVVDIPTYIQLLGAYWRYACDFFNNDYIFVDKNFDCLNLAI
jgi:hypothetical protein